MKIINQVLKESYENHLMPFLWMHGEEKKIIKEYLEKIADSRMKGVCLESRPYEAFLKDEWWSDMDFIIKECERLGMEIWILDDKHFPTGYAAGVVKEKYPRLRKMFLSMDSLDFVGPKKRAGIMLKWLKSGRQNVMNVGAETGFVQTNSQNEECKTEILGVLAAKKTGYQEIDENSIIILPYCREDETVLWDIPEGDWTVFLLFTTYEGGEAATEGYLNPLVKEATQVLIDTVYEPHYEKFKDKFGTVIRGFFSDEPRFGNIKGADASIGRKQMPLPWRKGLEKDMAEKIGAADGELLKKLPLLFIGSSHEANEIRYHYMDLVSRLFSENFSNIIGTWCEEHGVEYIGHILEDNNAHSRLGYGAGHFFRAMSGQHMSGIDVVLHQLIPGQNKFTFRSFTSSGWDGEFFTYGLAKLGASLGQLDPSKRGRTMCEVFGAYGWAEGMRLMKWVADHMLVNGVNYFVPHAFNMNRFPDSDCPPHFYAHGNNVEYESLGILSKYINRFATMISGGHHGGDVGLLYHAEAEWSGKYMLFQKPAKILEENQIEFDVVSADMLIRDAEFREGEYTIGGKKFHTLIVPYAQRLPKRLVEAIARMAENNMEIIFLSDLPQSFSETKTEISCSNCLKEGIWKEKIKTSGLENLQIDLETKDRILTDRFVPYLRYYHYIHTDGELFIFFNEDLYRNLEVDIQIPAKSPLMMYLPMENEIKHPYKHDGWYSLSLAKGETAVYFTTKEERFAGEKEKAFLMDLNEYPWEVDVGKGFGKPEKKHWEFPSMPDINSFSEFRNFSGELVYRTEFILSAEEALSQIILELEDVFEIAHVYLNGVDAGKRISYPYSYEISGKTRDGRNQLEIHVVNNMGRYMKDYLSQFLFMEPLGINGEVVLKIYRDKRKMQ